MMARLVEGRRAPRPWEAPPGVVSAIVDSETGLRVADGCEADEAYREIFLARHVPASACPGEMPWMADDEQWEREDEDDSRRAREAYLDALRDEIERRIRDSRRRQAERRDERREDEQRRRRERRRLERERRRLQEEDGR
jgi:hypothetical protein